MSAALRMKPRKVAANKTKAKAKTKRTGAQAKVAEGALSPITAPGSPEKFHVRVRMYRQGLGDCFLITFPREGKEPFHMLIDCGALGRNKQFMTRIVEHIRDTIREGKSEGKPRLDLVVATHEHKDHLSGFNQARE